MSTTYYPLRMLAKPNVSTIYYPLRMLAKPNVCNTSTISASDFAQEACFNLHEQNGDLFLRPHQNMKLGFGLAQETASEMKIICRLQNSSRLYVFIFHFFFSW